MTDYISELPDCVLSYILTKVSMKDLLKTRILSKRWSGLWTLRKNLDFDIFNVFGVTEEELIGDKYIIELPDNSILSPTEIVNLDDKRDEFVTCVDQFVKNFRGTTIDSLLVKFFLNCNHSTIIDQWISFAMEKGAERVELLFGGLLYPCLHKFYIFPLDLLSEINTTTLKHLSVESCLIFHPTNYDFNSFKNLRFLSLRKVKVDEIFIENMLSNCRLLQELQLDFCQFETSTSMYMIVSSSLLNLKIRGSYKLINNKAKRKVDLTLLDCLKLSSLKFSGYGLNTMTINTPMVKSIDLSILQQEDLNIFSRSYFLKVEIMSLDMQLMVSTKVLFNNLFPFS